MQSHLETSECPEGHSFHWNPFLSKSARKKKLNKNETVSPYINTSLSCSNLIKKNQHMSLHQFYWTVYRSLNQNMHTLSFIIKRLYSSFTNRNTDCHCSNKLNLHSIHPSPLHTIFSICCFDASVSLSSSNLYLFSMHLNLPHGLVPELGTCISRRASGSYIRDGKYLKWY